MRIENTHVGNFIDYFIFINSGVQINTMEQIYPLYSNIPDS